MLNPLLVIRSAQHDLGSGPAAPAAGRRPRAHTAPTAHGPPTSTHHSRPQPAFDSQWGGAWVPPAVGGAPSRHTSTCEVHATGVHRRGRVAPRIKQLGKQLRRCQAGQHRGDARAAERARTGGAKTAPCRGQRISTPLEESVHGLRSGGASDWKFHTKQCLPRRGSALFWRSYKWRLFGDLPIAPFAPEQRPS
jgi:hypothetical protein